MQCCAVLSAQWCRTVFAALRWLLGLRYFLFVYSLLLTAHACCGPVSAPRAHVWFVVVVYAVKRHFVVLNAWLRPLHLCTCCGLLADTANRHANHCAHAVRVDA
jgi:hypothetical protein